jgi:hypothetical protein
VDLVQGGASGFSWIVGAYKTTVTVTVAITVITITLSMCIYGVRADQRMRQDLKYGEGIGPLPFSEPWEMQTVFPPG